MSDIDSQLTLTASVASDIDSQLTVTHSLLSDVESAIDAGVTIDASTLSALTVAVSGGQTSDYDLTAYDYGSPIAFHMIDAVGDHIDLSDYDVIGFWETNGTKRAAYMSVVTAASGLVNWTPARSDIQPGGLEMEIELRKTDGSVVMTSPLTLNYAVRDRIKPRG